MYDRTSQMPAESCHEPDWEAEAALMKKNISILIRFRISLLEFIEVVGSHSLNRREGNSLAELLGIVTLDILERRKVYNKTLERLEGK